MTVQEFMVTKSGIPIHLNGFEYVKKAIEIQVKEPDMNMGEIIKKVSIECNNSFYSVERSMYRAIQNGFPLMNQEIKDLVFKGIESPKSKEYIRSIAYLIRNKLI